VTLKLPLIPLPREKTEIALHAIGLTVKTVPKYDNPVEFILTVLGIPPAHISSTLKKKLLKRLSFGMVGDKSKTSYIKGFNLEDYADFALSSELINPDSDERSAYIKRLFSKAVSKLKLPGNIVTFEFLNCPWNENVAIVVNEVVFYGIRILIYTHGNNLAVIKLGDFTSIEKPLKELREILLSKDPLPLLLEKYNLGLDDYFHDIIIAREELERALKTDALRPGIWLRAKRKLGIEYTHDGI